MPLIQSYVREKKTHLQLVQLTVWISFFMKLWFLTASNSCCTHSRKRLCLWNNNASTSKLCSILWWKFH